MGSCIRLTTHPFGPPDNPTAASTRSQVIATKPSQSVVTPTYSRTISNTSSQSASGRLPAQISAEVTRSKKRTALLGRIAAQQFARTQNPVYSNPVQTSFNWRSGRPMAGMLDIERSRTRRERTFIGSECAVCEEPLEHTLRGERILQFSCGHVSHEACFYEYIKEFESQYCPTCNAPLGLDTSRGGNVLDLGKVLKFIANHSLLNHIQRN